MQVTTFIDIKFQEPIITTIIKFIVVGLRILRSGSRTSGNGIRRGYDDFVAFFFKYPMKMK